MDIKSRVSAGLILLLNGTTKMVNIIVSCRMVGLYVLLSMKLTTRVVSRTLTVLKLACRLLMRILRIIGVKIWRLLRLSKSLALYHD